MTQEEMKRTNLILTAKQHETVRRLAFERGISMAAWVREAVQEKLEREGKA